MHGTITFGGIREEAVARRACLSFLIERDIMTAGDAATLIGAGTEVVEAILRADPVILDGRGIGVMDRLMATMTLLLDGYGPESMQKWFMTRMQVLGNQTPAQCLVGHADGPTRVLRHAEAWMS